jgi:hypothetical protein
MYGLSSSGSRQGPMVGSCEHGNELSDSINNTISSQGEWLKKDSSMEFSLIKPGCLFSYLTMLNQYLSSYGHYTRICVSNASSLQSCLLLTWYQHSHSAVSTSA